MDNKTIPLKVLINHDPYVTPFFRPIIFISYTIIKAMFVYDSVVFSTNITMYME